MELEATSWYQEHKLAIMGPERLQEMGSYLTLEKLEKMMRPFAMPAEDFPPPSTPQGFSGYFLKSAAVLERLVNLWPFHKHGNTNGTILDSFLLMSACLSSIEKPFILCNSGNEFAEKRRGGGSGSQVTNNWT